MLDTVGPELQVVNKTEHPISLQADTLVVLTPDKEKEATTNLLPINFNGLSKVIFIVIFFCVISFSFYHFCLSLSDVWKVHKHILFYFLGERCTEMFSLTELRKPRK